MQGDKYTKIDPKNPKGKGVCDISGFYFSYSDLVPQMEWRGNNKIWTGWLVGKPFVSKPQPQLRPPKIKADPVAFANPRPPTPYIAPGSNPVPPWPEVLKQLNEFHWGK